MRILVDTNVLLRAAQPEHFQYRVAFDSLHQLATSQHELCLVPQVVFEYWVVATRPRTANGLGFSPAETGAQVRELLANLTLLSDTPAIFQIWLGLVTSSGASGKPAHDARLVAAMQSHSITDLLTFNRADFARYPHVVVHVPA